MHIVTEEVHFIRHCKKQKERRGAACWKNPNEIFHIGTGFQYGSSGVYGCGENDGAAQWYTTVPSNGANPNGKHRTPPMAIGMKVIVRVIHGLTLLATLTAPWVRRSGNSDFNMTCILVTFLQLETLVERLPKKWCEHFDAGDGNWTNDSLLFYSYLVEQNIFDEMIISRHMPGHTHEKVDGEHIHIRAFMLGLLKKTVGAIIALPSQLVRAMTSIVGDRKGIWIRNK